MQEVNAAVMLFCVYMVEEIALHGHILYLEVQ